MKVEVSDSSEELKPITNAVAEDEQKEKSSTRNDAVKRSELGSVDDIKNLFKDASRIRNSPTGMPATGMSPSQLTIFYGGSVIVFDAIHADKVREIILTAGAAAAAANCGDKKNVDAVSPTAASPVLTRSPSIQSTTGALASPGPQLYPGQGNSHCKLQGELPVARRHSLQRFFEKRRDRLVSKNPYPSSAKKPSDNKDANLCAAAFPDANCFEKSSTQEVQTKAAAKLN